MSYYDEIKTIYAENGFVYIITQTKGDVVITIDEAISRAEAIKHLDSDEFSLELANQLMQAAWKAKIQIDGMSKDDKASFDLVKEDNLNALFKYGKNRRV